MVILAAGVCMARVIPPPGLGGYHRGLRDTKPRAGYDSGPGLGVTARFVRLPLGQWLKTREGCPRSLQR